MDRWLTELRNNLTVLSERSLLRRLRAVEETGGTGRLVRRDGRELINLASNDYLALSRHPRLKQAAIEAIQQWGTGSGASRLTGGDLAIHRRVEQRFAAFKHAEAALLCPT